MRQKILKFPHNFLWGAATSSHQSEGGNRNDWKEWELKNAARLAIEAPITWKHRITDWKRIEPEATDPANYISGQASFHYSRYKEDIRNMKSLGFSAYRFSIEWSRVQPTQGEFDGKEIEHYRNVITELKNNGIEPFITLWHRSNPVWMANNGDWENKENVRHYLIYVQRMVQEFHPLVKYWMPLNEPIFYLLGSYVGGEYPPQVKNIFRAEKVFKNLVDAFCKASELIHEIDPHAQVGTADAAMYLEPYKNRWYNKLTIKIMDWYCNKRFTEAALPYADFLGVQYYSRGLVGWQWANWYPSPKQIIEAVDGSPSSLRLITQDSDPFPEPEKIIERVDGNLASFMSSRPTNAFEERRDTLTNQTQSDSSTRRHSVGKTKYPLSDMGWEIYPQGLYNFLMQIKRYNKPIIITENGIADALNAHRTEFIKQHLMMLLKVIRQGVDVRGYLHWSLLDNLEWNKGFWPKFGLIEVNRATGERTIRKSAYAYSEIIKQNGINLP